MSFRRIRYLAPIGLAALFGTVSRLPACPLCKETVGENSAGLGEGFSLSIYVMLGALAILGTYMIWRLAREARAAGDEAAAAAINAASTPVRPEPSSAPPARSR